MTKTTHSTTGRASAWPRITAALGLAVVLGSGCAPAQNPSASCAAPETLAGVKSALFNAMHERIDTAASIQGFDDVGVTLALDLPRLVGVDETTGKVDCAANAVLKVKPELKDQVKTDAFTDGIAYSIQPSADGKGVIYEFSGAAVVLESLVIAAHLQNRRLEAPAAAPPATANAAGAGAGAGAGDTGSSPVNLPGETMGQVEICQVADPTQCLTTPDEGYQVFILSIDHEGMATIRLGETLYKIDDHHAVVTYGPGHDCQVRLSAYNDDRCEAGQ